MNEEKFFKDERLTFAEGRYSKDSARQFKPHMHRRLSIGTVNSGMLNFRIEDEVIELKPGSLALINPDTLHSCNPEPMQARSFFMLYLDPSWCLQIQQTLFKIDSFIPMHTTCITDQELFTLYIGTMEYIMNPAMQIPEKKSRLTTLAEFLFARACSPAGEYQPVTISDVERLKQLLAENLDQDFPLASAAEILHANPYTLLRLFRRHTGITPHAYRMNCRIELARRLLQQGEDIADTALRCGFFDQSHFHRHFKAMTTVTPGEYQRSIQKSS